MDGVRAAGPLPLPPVLADNDDGERVSAGALALPAIEVFLASLSISLARESSLLEVNESLEEEVAEEEEVGGMDALAKNGSSRRSSTVSSVSSLLTLTGSALGSSPTKILISA